MAQRTVALCDGKYIGIETIYTVINGQQINIPDKLKELRKKSRTNKLFCPCGCGTNLILVAGDKNLREQHFRRKNDTNEYRCNMPTEGETSIYSKIVLKCWLDDKLKANDLESRVPIDTISDMRKKPEFTFLSREKKYAIRYWKARSNIMDGILDILEKSISGIKILYMVDASNGCGNGQYPEALMKLQDRQNYCLLLSIKGMEYYKASLRAVLYDKDLDGLWKELSFAEGLLAEYTINDNHDVVFSGKTLDQLFHEAKNSFQARLKEEKQQKIDAEKQRKEYLRKLQEEEEQHLKENQRQQEDAEKRLKIQKKEKHLEFAEKQKLETEKKQAKKFQKEEKSKPNIKFDLSQQEIPVKDANGNRWVTCEFCGKVAMEIEFISYGGVGRVNLGTCKDCSMNNPLVKRKLEEEISTERKRYAKNVCPECGGTLREKGGQFGRFIGCNNYPRCKYTRKKESGV